MNLGGPEMMIVLVVVLLLFGGKKLPELARSLGKAQKEFKEGMAEGGSDAPATPDASTAPAASATAPAASATAPAASATAAASTGAAGTGDDSATADVADEPETVTTPDHGEQQR
jgi:sec-independent protein translocase protein TatA